MNKIAFIIFLMLTSTLSFSKNFLKDGERDEIIVQAEKDICENKLKHFNELIKSIQVTSYKIGYK